MDQTGSYLTWLSLLWSHVFLEISWGELPKSTSNQACSSGAQNDHRLQWLQPHSYHKYASGHISDISIQSYLQGTRERVEKKHINRHMFVACKAGLKYQVYRSVVSMKPPNQTTMYPPSGGPNLVVNHPTRWTSHPER